MNAKQRVFHLLLLTMLALTSIGARQQQFSGWGTPRLVRDLELSTPTVESELNVSSDAMTQDTMIANLPKLSGTTVQLLTRKFSITDIEGKKFEDFRRTDLDNLASVNSSVYENEPSMAVNPTNEQIAVIFSHYYNESIDGSCQAVVSYDGGDTFDYNVYVFPPMLNAGDSCSDPVVRFSPDGLYAYYFYMNVFASTGFETSSIVMQRASGSDPTVLLGSPITVFDSGGVNFLDKEWGDVHTWDAANGGTNGGVLYATSTKFYSNGDCAIVFNVSLDHGATWQYSTASPLVLDYSSGCGRVIQGSRPIGGNYNSATGGNFMMVCWYDSDFDGYLSGVFYIDCLPSGNYGLSDWSPFYAYPGGVRKYEVPTWLGPTSNFHRWRASMFPSLAVDEQGMVYLGFTQDPSVNHFDTESGNVYVSQKMLNYGVIGAWPAPAAVGSGSTAQGYVTLAARYDATIGKYAVYVAYSDYTANNISYWTVYRKGTRLPTATSVAYGSKIKISDRASLSDNEFIGDYIDSAITGRRYHVVWTDRSDVYSKFDYDDDIVHDVIMP